MARSDEPAPSPSLRERNKLRAREEIATAALSLFIERGFEAVTIDDIAAAVGVSRRTFFRYFKTKEDALLSDYPRLSEVLNDAIEKLDEDSVLGAMETVMHRLADVYLDAPELVLARSDVLRDSDAAAARNLRQLAEFEAALANVIASRLDGDVSDLLPRAGAVLLIAAFRVALTQWVRVGGKADLHALLDDAFGLIEHGLSGPFSGAKAPARRRAVKSRG